MSSDAPPRLCRSARRAVPTLAYEDVAGKLELTRVLRVRLWGLRVDEVRGKPIRCRVACTPLLAGGKPDGVILMMDETPRA